MDIVKFYVDNSDNQHPILMVKISDNPPAAYAENIEDLQLTYKLMNGTITDVPPLSRNIREVRITLTARTDKPDPDFPTDPYRQRTYTSKVNLRNLDI
jgi:hypothetical protein